MGTIALVPWVTTEMTASFESQVVVRTLEALKKRAFNIRGSYIRV